MASVPLKFDREISRSSIIREAYPESVFWDEAKQPYVVTPERNGRRSIISLNDQTDLIALKNKIKASSGEVQRCLGVIRPENRKFALLEIDKVDAKTDKWVRSYRLVEAGTQLLQKGGTLEYNLSFSSKVRLDINSINMVGEEAERLNFQMVPTILAALPSVENYILKKMVTKTSIIGDGEESFTGFNRMQIPLKEFMRVWERLSAEKQLYTPGTAWYRVADGAKWYRVISKKTLPKEGDFVVRKNSENIFHLTSNGVVVAVEVENIVNNPNRKKTQSSFVTYYYVPFDLKEKTTQIQVREGKYLLEKLPLTQQEKIELPMLFYMAKARVRALSLQQAKVVV